MNKKKKKKNNNLIFYVETIAIIVLLIYIIKLLAPAKNTENTGLSTSTTQEEAQPMSTQEVSMEPVTLEEPSSVQGADISSVSGNTIDDGELNIVVFGDSIWDDARYQDGVSEQIAALTGGKVYNCAMGGTSATLVGESKDVETWDSRSLNGMTYIATGRTDAYNQLEGYDAKDIIESIDFNKVDYFIFSYGLNDYFSKVKIMPEDLLDMTTYVGALRHGTQIMKEAFPQARFLIVSPTYCQFKDHDVVVDDSNTRDYGEGTLEAYVDGAALVAGEYNTLYLDAYHNFGINKDTATTYLRDGIHLTPEGRSQYAKQVADYIMSLENAE